jgi:hypothetical protein
LVQTDSGKNASSLGFSFLVRLAFVCGACCPSLMCHTTIVQEKSLLSANPTRDACGIW